MLLKHILQFIIIFFIHSIVSECENSDDFECNDGSCWPGIVVCDGYCHCNECEDEYNSTFCATYCPDGSWYCESGQFGLAWSGPVLYENCVYDRVLCDGQCDCNECEDEGNCDTLYNCPYDQHFVCESGRDWDDDNPSQTACIPYDDRCDEHCGCNECEDEANCGYGCVGFHDTKQNTSNKTFCIWNENTFLWFINGEYCSVNNSYYINYQHLNDWLYDFERNETLGQDNTLVLSFNGTIWCIRIYDALFDHFISDRCYAYCEQTDLFQCDGIWYSQSFAGHDQYAVREDVHSGYCEFQTCNIYGFENTSFCFIGFEGEYITANGMYHKKGCIANYPYYQHESGSDFFIYHDSQWAYDVGTWHLVRNIPPEVLSDDDIIDSKISILPYWNLNSYQGYALYSNYCTDWSKFIIEYHEYKATLKQSSFAEWIWNIEQMLCLCLFVILVVVIIIFILKIRQFMKQRKLEQNNNMNTAEKDQFLNQTAIENQDAKFSKCKQFVRENPTMISIAKFIALYAFNCYDLTTDILLSIEWMNPVYILDGHCSYDYKPYGVILLICSILGFLLWLVMDQMIFKFVLINKKKYESYSSLIKISLEDIVSIILCFLVAFDTIRLSTTFLLSFCMSILSVWIHTFRHYYKTITVEQDLQDKSQSFIWFHWSILSVIFGILVGTGSLIAILIQIESEPMPSYFIQNIELCVKSNILTLSDTEASTSKFLIEAVQLDETYFVGCHIDSQVTNTWSSTVLACVIQKHNEQIQEMDLFGHDAVGCRIYTKYGECETQNCWLYPNNVTICYGSTTPTWSS